MRTLEELKEYVEEENIRFLRLAFFDVFGVQKNVSILPDELEKAMTDGISIDASAIAGFGGQVRSDLFLIPEPETLTIVPWRSFDGKVARMFCRIIKPDGVLFELDSREILRGAVRKAKEEGVSVDFGAAMEFYVFRKDENGEPTDIPLDRAGYMDMAPEDRGENLRRDICGALRDMGITPESSHHEQGPGQNEIDFRYSDALTSADNTATFIWTVKNTANANGCAADFSPKPLKGMPGNGMHINISIDCSDGKDRTMQFMAGVMRHVREMTLFFNRTTESYDRLGAMEAPGYISWSEQNRSQLIRIPAVRSGHPRIELRSPDPMANPYLVYALLIYAGLDGIRHHMTPDRPMNINLYKADPELTDNLSKLPLHIGEAAQYARSSEFIRGILPPDLLKAYCDYAAEQIR